MIHVEHVTHHYGVRPVLRDVSMTIATGEVVALMGPNGMGKSTLVGVLAGLLWPLKGYVEFDGKRRRRSEEEELAIRREVVYLPADPWTPRFTSGREWILAVGRVYGIDEERLLDHTQRLLTLFDLEVQADMNLSGYSTGQRKKAALCCALVTEAPIMLLDEPFAGGLDPSGILALRRVLQHLAKNDSSTIVMATPVPELVEELADRVAVLKDGRLIVYDTIDGLRKSAEVGADARLDLIYEKLVNPHTAQNLERYFEGAGR